MGFCDFKDVVAFGNNQLWRPQASKVQGHRSGLPKKMVSLVRLHVHFNTSVNTANVEGTAVLVIAANAVYIDLYLHIYFIIDYCPIIH